MIINHNLGAMNANRNMGINANNASKSMEKLSSGLRINKAGDDAAGLAISEKMRGQIRGLDQASANAQDGISMVQTAEGALNETHSILQRMRELADQSANGTNTEGDRGSIQDEMNQLTSEINRIGNTTEFNTQKVLNGGMDSGDGAKITKATNAIIAGTGTFAAATVGSTGTTASIKVDNQTFNFTAATGATIDSTIATLKDITSGGVKLSDLVDITKNGSEIVFTAKSSGSTSEIKITAGTAAAAALTLSTAAATTIDATGDPTLVERAGLKATDALDTGAAITIAANSTFKIEVGTASAVTVTLNPGATAKTYDTANPDKNVSNAAMQDLVKDLNASLQNAGLSGSVTASLSKDNEIQFISETGQDLKLTDGTSTPLDSYLGFSAPADMTTPTNVSQVVGPGVQGSGFNTTFQIGANKGQLMSLSINDMRSAALGVTGNAGQAGFTAALGVTNGTTDVKQEAALNLLTKEDATKSLEVLDKAIATVSSERGKLGAIANRLEHTIANLGTSSENLTTAESRIRDVDMAKEMSTFSKNNILSQAAQAMLAQANQQPQQVLQLLR
ncbi:MAG TPA: flagellin [Desulfosporosinus sp.]|nr:flagellin [Desulfosporosinus sp.]